MRTNTKRSLLLALALCLLAVTAIPVASAAPSPAIPLAAEPDLALTAKSAVLMEASTGTILYQKDPEKAMPPASVTKIMTLLLVMECIDAGTLAWEDTVTASARAASMGGSQIYLKEGEQMTARDLIKSVVIASANDAAVALAEHTYGSEEAFVGRMNERAAELGIEAGECTLDGKFSLEACRCVGACGLAPVIMINEEVYGRMTPGQVQVVLAKYKDA